MSADPDWARALGAPLFVAKIRSVPAEFVVEEELTIDFSGDGEHDLLHIEKTGANTQWVAERLARHAAVPVRDVGFAGMKDRHALTRQWFSVRRPDARGTDWDAFGAAGVHILERHRHHRKLRRGAHRGNAFRIALRAAGLAAIQDDIAARVTAMAAGGVPNYFGEQRFGHDRGNLELCRSMFAGRRVSRGKRSIALSAARALIFNDIVDARVRTATWNTILPGELVNLHDSASVFAVDDVSDTIQRRCAALDVHPSGTLWGIGAPRGGGRVADLERQVAARHSDLAEGLRVAGVDATSRALRLCVSDLEWVLDADVLWLEFRLGRGGYATSVLREIAAQRPRNST